MILEIAQAVCSVVTCVFGALFLYRLGCGLLGLSTGNVVEIKIKYHVIREDD